jgi:aldose 1-epimerase
MAHKVDRPPSGEQFEIRRGRQRAVVTEVGATLREYVAAGRAVIDGFALDEMCHGARGQVLMPWPNRIGDGTYSFDGVHEILPINEPGNRTAIHGLARWLTWERTRGDAECVRMETWLVPQPGYPWQVRLGAEYRLGEDGLHVTLDAVNHSATPAPFGAGCHPYLAAPGGQVDAGELRIPAEEYLEVDERMLPTGRRLPVAGSPLDFRARRPIGGTVIDACFLPTRREAQFCGTTLWWEAAFRFLQAFTADTLSPPARRRSLAMEPMTCPANAFKTGEGLISLPPGERWRGEWGLSPG